jgi:hypothetical protein
MDWERSQFEFSLRDFPMLRNGWKTNEKKNYRRNLYRHFTTRICQINLFKLKNKRAVCFSGLFDLIGMRTTSWDIHSREEPSSAFDIEYHPFHVRSCLNECQWFLFKVILQTVSLVITPAFVFMYKLISCPINVQFIREVDTLSDGEPFWIIFIYLYTNIFCKIRKLCKISSPYILVSN